MAKQQRPHSNSVWTTRIGDGMYQVVRVSDKGEDRLQISLFPGNKKDGLAFTVPRADARLLARRINQCLDATRKR